MRQLAYIWFVLLVTFQTNELKAQQENHPFLLKRATFDELALPYTASSPKHFVLFNGAKLYNIDNFIHAHLNYQFRGKHNQFGISTSVSGSKELRRNGFSAAYLRSLSEHLKIGVGLTNFVYQSQIRNRNISIWKYKTYASLNWDAFEWHYSFSNFIDQNNQYASHEFETNYNFLNDRATLSLYHQILNGLENPSILSVQYRFNSKWFFSVAAGFQPNTFAFGGGYLYERWGLYLMLERHLQLGTTPKITIYYGI